MTSSCLRPVDYSVFQKLRMTIGKAVKVEQNPSAIHVAYLIRLVLSQPLIEEHTRLYKKNVYTSSAQLCANHAIEDILEQNLLTVINFPRKQIGKSMSDCLTTGVQKETTDQIVKQSSTVFVRPSGPVELGSRVGILAEEEIFTSNPRDLNWGEFFSLDLRIGTLIEFQSLTQSSEIINKVFFSLDLGEMGIKRCVSLLKADTSPDVFLGKQVLVLTNLNEEAKRELFDASTDDVVLCTIAGHTVLEPAIPVENGFKLA